jgi:hypothetical protein
MRLAIVVFCFLASNVAAEAQGISNARDGSGNIVDKGLASRNTPSAPTVNNQTTPMVNRSIAPTPPQAPVLIQPRAIPAH